MTDKETYILARWSYSVGQPIYSDAEYNVMHSAMKDLYPDWEYVNRTWSEDPCPTELLKSIGREDLIYAIVLSDKTESIPSLNTWTDVRDTLNPLIRERLFTASMKHDGWNIQVTYYNGQIVGVFTRGRSSDAVDVTGLKSLMPETIPVKGRVKVVGECTVSFALFREMKEKFNNALPRSAVSTALANPEYIKRLSFHAFDIIGYTPDDMFATLIQWGFKTPAYLYVDGKESVESVIGKLSEAHKTYPYPTDGIVFASGSYKRAVRVAAWEEPIYKSYITGYEESYGPYTISMKLAIRPVSTVKGKQYRLPITNLSRIIENNLKIGSPVAFRIVSGANADIDLDTTKLLHKQYYNRYTEFKALIDREETFRDSMAKF